MRGLSLEEVLDAVAARTPAPGGGAVAALAGALAAGLVEMAARFTAVTPRVTEIVTRSGELRGHLLGLAEVELHAYEPVLEALRLPREDPMRPARLAAARSGAAESPFEIALATAELAGLGAELALAGNPNLEGDAVTGCLLAEAACQAATRLVEINLRGEEEDPRMGVARDPRVGQARELSERAHAERRRALSR
jgi:methenyltetrahydrofolate cyclohydrolase